MTGNHVAQDGETISNDCGLCHNILAYQVTNPKVLSDLGLTGNAMATQ